MSAIYTRKGYRYRSNLGVLPNSKYFSSVRNTGTILFSVCSEHHAFHSWLSKMVCKGHFHWFFPAQSLSGLIIVQGCAGEATCIFGQFPFRPFQKLSDSQLQGFDCNLIVQRFQVCNLGRVETANDFTPAKHMLVPQFCDILTSSNFPCPGIKHEIFSIAMFDDRRLFPFGFFCQDSMIIECCLGWHLLLEAPSLLPQATKMDRDPISITACTSQRHLNHEFLSQITCFVCAAHMRNFSMLNFWFGPFLFENRSQPVILLFRRAGF